jgi:predicted Zn-dependent protease
VILNKIIPFFYFVVLITLLTACASKKQLTEVSKKLDETTTLLTSTKNSQDLLQIKVQSLEDSILKLNTQIKKERINTEYELFKTAQISGDKVLAAASLTRLVELDPAQGYWVYDSLVLYHYMYFFTPGMPRPSQAAWHYAEKGLAMNPKNEFLLETKAKLLIEVQQDSAAYKIFNSLWDQYGDYTYLWEMTYVDLLIFQNIKRAEAAIAEVVKNKQSEISTVRIEILDEHYIENVPAKAAFLYLRAILQNAQGQSAKAKKTLQEVIKIAPAFITAKRSLYQLNNPEYR